MINISESITGSEPISLSVQKAWMRVLYTDEDDLITSLITQTRGIVENYLGISIIAKTITLRLTGRDHIQLPYGPVTSIVSVKDEDDNDIDYDVLNEEITFSTTVNYAEIVYTTDIGTVPSGLELALKQVCMRYYENRGEDANLSLLTNEITTLKPYRRKLWI